MPSGQAAGPDGAAELATDAGALGAALALAEGAGAAVALATGSLCEGAELALQPASTRARSRLTPGV